MAKHWDSIKCFDGFATPDATQPSGMQKPCYKNEQLSDAGKMAFFIQK
jgi:hypothetical protein